LTMDGQMILGAKIEVKIRFGVNIYVFFLGLDVMINYSKSKMIYLQLSLYPGSGGREDSPNNPYIFDTLNEKTRENIIYICFFNICTMSLA